MRVGSLLEGERPFTRRGAVTETRRTPVAILRLFGGRAGIPGIEPIFAKRDGDIPRDGSAGEGIDTKRLVERATGIEPS